MWPTAVLLLQTKECALFLPGDRALSVFGVGRQLLAAFLCAILNQILNHFLKRLGPDRLVQKAVKMVTSPSHWLARHTFIALCSAACFYCPLFRSTLLLPSVHLQTSSVSAGTSDLCVWQTHIATNTLSAPPLSHSHFYTHTSTSMRVPANNAHTQTHTHTHTHTQLGSWVYSLACIIIKRTQCVCVCVYCYY